MCTGAEIAAALASAAPAAGVGEAATGVGTAAALPAAGMGAGTAALFGPTAAGAAALGTAAPAAGVGGLATGLGGLLAESATPLAAGIPALAGGTEGAGFAAQAQGALTNLLGGGTAGMDRVEMLGKGMDTLGKVQKAGSALNATGLLQQPKPAGGAAAPRPPMAQPEPMPNVMQRMGAAGGAGQLSPVLLAQLRARGIDPMQYLMMMQRGGG